MADKLDFTHSAKTQLYTLTHTFTHTHTYTYTHTLTHTHKKNTFTHTETFYTEIITQNYIHLTNTYFFFLQRPKLTEISQVVG